MSDKTDTSYSLFCAVREGKIQKVREIINAFGLSYSQAWSNGYVLLRDAIENKHTDIAKLLLEKGCKVNTTNPCTKTPLHYAVKNKNVEIIELLLRRRANINAKNNYGRTPLHNAIGNVQITELLLSHGADVNATDNSGMTPLHFAVDKCDNIQVSKSPLFKAASIDAKRKTQGVYSQVVQQLLNHGANVNCVCTCNLNGKEGYTPLHLAAERGNKEIINLLLSSNALINAKAKDDLTPLHIAIKNGREKIVKLFLKHGANINCVKTNGYTPLHLAAEIGNEEMINLLLSNNAHINANAKDVTPLHIATKNRREKIVKLLLDHGANVDAQDKDGKTALRFAVEERHAEIIKYILKYCPDINSNRSSLIAAVHGTNKEYKTIIEMLLQYGFTVNSEDINDSELVLDAVKNGYLKIVDTLLKCGADVNKMIKGYTLLHIAIKYNQEELVTLLMNCEVDVNAKDDTGKPPIFYAIQKTDLKLTKLLLTNGATVKGSPDLLCAAVKTQCVETVEILLQHDADINASDENGMTALQHIVSREPYRYSFDSKKDPDTTEKIAKLLLSRGADVNAYVNDKTTLILAIESRNEKVVETLLEYNADVNLVGNTGISPLHVSAKIGNEVVSEILLKKGAKVDTKDKNGLTALHLAAEKNHPIIIMLLLKFGADIDSTDENGKTALHIASINACIEAVTALLDYGSDINITTKNNLTVLDIIANGRFRVSFFENREQIRNELLDILQQHLVKMKTANLYLKEKYSIYGGTFSEDFQNECETELEILRKSKINSHINVSFYDILTKSLNQLARYASNENIVYALESDYTMKFPIYAGLINSRFRKGVERRQLLDQGIIFFPELPYNCTELIINYLSNRDLRIFVDAYKSFKY